VIEKETFQFGNYAEALRATDRVTRKYVSCVEEKYQGKPRDMSEASNPWN
jgi:hypothetical protein